MPAENCPSLASGNYPTGDRYRPVGEAPALAAQSIALACAVVREARGDVLIVITPATPTESPPVAAGGKLPRHIGYVPE